MKFASKYQDFLELLLEEYLKLDAPLYYSRALKETLAALSNKGDKVAKFLYYAEQNDDVQVDITFVDLGNGNDKVSFIQVNRVLRMIDKEMGDPESKNQGTQKGQLPQDYLFKMGRMRHDTTRPVWNQQRTELQVGRFAAKVIQKAKDPAIKSFTQNDINTFVDNFKAYRDFQSSKKDRFEIVQGEEIRKWYDEDTYEDAAYHLNNSCMRYDRCQRYLNIYTENPNQVTMVIMKGTDPNKIIGRALIWKLDNGSTYLDRPYANNDEDVNLFKQWGKDKGYTVYGDSYQHKQVTLDKSNFQYYPYMDTFKYLNRDKNLLSTDSNEFDNGNQDWIRLESTGGDYEEAHQGVWSEYYQEYIDEDNAVYAEDVQSYINSDDSIYLEYKDIYVTQEADVVYSEYDSNYYYEHDAVHSEYLDDWIYSDDSIEVHYTAEDTTYVPSGFETRGLVDELKVNGEWKKCILACIFKSPFANEYLFRFGTVLVYKLEDGTLVTEQEAEEKDIDVQPLDASFYVDLDEYMSKVEKITKEDLLTKLQEYTFSNEQIQKFKYLLSSRAGFRSDLRRFFDDDADLKTMNELLRMLIYFSYKESEKNDYGKPRRKNRVQYLDDNESIVAQFIDKEIINRLSSPTVELMFGIADAQISNLISDKNFLAQIIMLKSST
jgi:hypothetical protein